MKLIKRTYLHTAIWLLPLIIIGSIFCFYMIKYIVYEETDEFLTYEMERLVNYHKQNSNLPEFHKVADIIEDLKFETPVFKDTLILEQGDNEMVPHRELYFTINHKNHDFTIVLRHLLPGNDDIMQGTILIVSGLLLLISVVFFLMVNFISGRIWKPFYITLDTLKNFRFTSPLPKFPKSDINEFNTLNDSVQSLLMKILHDYQRTKEFNENASHELQTHLSIIRANAEKLMNTFHQSNISFEQIQAIHYATVKLSKSQKSLLLLSKIGNLEYSNNVSLNIAKIVHQSLSMFQEALDIRNISVKKNIEESIQFMDVGLAEILVTNLLKNAVKHNIQDGYVSIIINQSSFVLENSGLPFIGNPNTLLERFIKGEKGNIGIGLSIVKQICELYNFKITYQINDNTVHKLSIQFMPE